jgi:hypothetical protein
MARIMRNRVTQILGRFAEEEEAAAAYRAADAALARGEELVPALHPLDGGREISASEITSLLSRTRTLDAQWDPKDSRCMIHKYGSKVCMKEVCMKEGEEGEEPGITRCMNHKSRGMIGTNRAGHVRLSAVMQDRGSVVQREWGNHARKRWLDKLRATNEECWAEVTVENQTRAFYTASLLKAGWLTRKPSPP